jgi:hypothetical protein
MLLFMVVVATINLALGWLLFLSARRGDGASAILWGSLVALLGLCMLPSPLMLVQLLGIVIIGAVMGRRQASSLGYLSIGALTSAVVFSVMGLVSLGQWSHVRRDYPLVSLADRLNYEHRSVAPASPGVAAMPKSTTELTDQIRELEDLYQPGYVGMLRTRSLELAHASRVQQFISTPGFGVGRMLGPSPGFARRGDEPESPIAQRPLPAALEVSASLSEAAPGRQDSALGAAPAESRELHRAALLDFGQPERFGYVQDVDHVSGFQPHRFSRFPELGEPKSKSAPVQWRMARVELVSLLKHDRPMVYVSKNLPRMDELGDAPVRSLDSFEAHALSVLAEGKEIVSQSRPERIRMLGAVRAVEQCLNCHQVERGVMLGAFSYEIVPVGTVEMQHPVDEPALEAL